METADPQVSSKWYCFCHIDAFNNRNGTMKIVEITQEGIETVK
jgi:hypothetical protein